MSDKRRTSKRAAAVVTPEIGRSNDVPPSSTAKRAASEEAPIIEISDDVPHSSTDKRAAAEENRRTRRSRVRHSFNDDLISPLSSTDIHVLFAKYNNLLFNGKLDGVKLEWSNKMTESAGLCRMDRKDCCIRLSRPLLSQRPHSDLVETLLHEMIHAYQHVTNTSDVTSHGKNFHAHMERINKQIGTNITVFHTFHDEVETLKKHWWRCDGPCRDQGPFYGWVKRPINKAPGPNDGWWRSHRIRCGGSFVKVKEPIEYTKKRLAGLFGFRDSHFSNPMGSSRLYLNNCGFEVVQCGENSGQHKGAESHGPFFDAKKNEPLVDCPLCKKVVSRFELHGHLQVCENLQRLVDLQRLLDMDEVESRVEKCFRSEKDMTFCPLCDESLFKDDVQTHLKACESIKGLLDDDGLQPMDDDDIINKKDVEKCPFCSTYVQGDLSLHISTCVCNDIVESEFHDFDNYAAISATSTGNNNHNSDSELKDEECSMGENDTASFPLCDQNSLKTNVETRLNDCEKLKRLGDKDGVHIVDDDNIINKKGIEKCPLCNTYVEGDLSLHIGTCVCNDVLESEFHDFDNYAAISATSTGNNNHNSDSELKDEETRKKDCEKLKRLGDKDGVHIVDDDNIVNKKDIEKCPLCNTCVQGNLSLHISRCLGSNIFKNFEENNLSSGNIVDGTEEKCLVCEKVLHNVPIHEHLETCESVQGIFDESDSNSSQNPTPTLTTCPMCGLKDINDMKSHLEQDCFNTLDISEESSDSFPCSSNSYINSCDYSLVNDIRVSQRNRLTDNEGEFPILDTKRKKHGLGIKSDHSQVKNDIVNDHDVKIDEKITYDNALNDEKDPLTYCRGCKKFYSVSLCPVCC